MPSKNKTQHRIQLVAGHFDRLQDIAARFGFLHKAGPGTSKVGSLSGLLDAIASGKIKLLGPVDESILNKKTGKIS